MTAHKRGEVVLLPFPFTDLSVERAIAAAIGLLAPGG